MKKIIVLFLTTMLIGNCYSQSAKVGLTDEAKLTYKDILEIKLQILASQLSSGSYSIIDMGRMHFPVSIRFNENNMIVFEIEGKIKPEYSEDIHKEIITESFTLVDVSIYELIKNNYPQIDFDTSNNIIGYWYYEESEGHIPKAKWEKGKFEWITFVK